jgi:hypothetical protein
MLQKRKKIKRIFIHAYKQQEKKRIIQIEGEKEWQSTKI